MPRDTKEILYCPACAKEMKKVYIESASCNVDICTDGCGGIFFDNRELERFDEQHENIDEILVQLKDKKFEPQDQTKTRICPYCGAPIVKIMTSCKEDAVEIDNSYTCGSTFLDYGELEKIRQEFDTIDERIDDFNKYSVEKFQKIFDNIEYNHQKPTKFSMQTRNALSEIVSKYL